MTNLKRNMSELSDMRKSKMRNISLTEFIDFSNKSGITKINKVDSIDKNSDYRPYKDYYKSLRDCFIDYLKLKVDKSYLDQVIQKEKDPIKASHFKEISKGFRKFLRSYEVIYSEMTPSFTFWEPIEDFKVRVNPEICLKINGVETIVKMHFNCRKESVLRVNTAKCMIRLMQNAFHEFHEDKEFAIWDIRRNRLFKLSDSDNLKRIDGFLTGEAKSFAEIRKTLRQS